MTTAGIQSRAPVRRSGITGIVLTITVAMALAGCIRPGDRAEINTKTKFAKKEYGVKASPRVTVRKKVRKGGGRYMVGKPYKVKGHWYKPRENPNYTAVGYASWYGPNFHGRLTANGEVFDQYSISAAHPTMPLPSYARVTNLKNGRSLIVRVNDRGPFAKGRVIDLSARAAKLLDYTKSGTAKVKVQYVGKARLDGHDQKFLLASLRGPGEPKIAPGATMPGTMLAMADPVPAKPVAAATTLDAQASALNGEFQVASAHAIPVPTGRPVTLSGIPLDVASPEPLMTASLAPLGYREDDSVAVRFASAFAAFDHEPAAKIEAADKAKGDASQTMVIRLGTYQEASHAQFVRQTFSDLGMTTMRRLMPDKGRGWEVRLLVGGDVAAQALEIARNRGLTGAELVTR